MDSLPLHRVGHPSAQPAAAVTATMRMRSTGSPSHVPVRNRGPGRFLAQFTVSNCPRSGRTPARTSPGGGERCCAPTSTAPTTPMRTGRSARGGVTRVRSTQIRRRASEPSVVDTTSIRSRASDRRPRLARVARGGGRGECPRYGPGLCSRNEGFLRGLARLAYGGRVYSEPDGLTAACKHSSRVRCHTCAQCALDSHPQGRLSLGLHPRHPADLGSGRVHTTDRTHALRHG